jgi:GNAT superfamily N-acetyltransferase
MGSAPQVRNARVEDAAAMAVLAGELGYPTPAAVMAARLGGLLDRPNRHIRVAEADGVLLGWIEVGRRLTLDSDERVEILGLVVASAARGRGIGRLLVADAEAWARSLGLPTLVVRSNVLREGSHPFYRHLGFEQRKTQHYYLKVL